MEPKPISNRTRNGWLIALALMVAWIVYLSVNGPREVHVALEPPPLRPPIPARKADYRWTFTDLKGQPVALEQYRGRTVFLNFWATWCGPCKAEMPAIERLAADPRLKAVAFLLVSLDEDRDTVTRFLGPRAKDAPVFWSGTRPLPEVFQTSGIPATFVIAPDGRIATMLVGSAQWDDPSVVNYLMDLMAVDEFNEEGTESGKKEK